jgi:hypothetical protein
MSRNRPRRQRRRNLDSPAKSLTNSAGGGNSPMGRRIGDDKGLPKMTGGYGLRKFIVVVPAVAIRVGAFKTG